MGLVRSSGFLRAGALGCCLFGLQLVALSICADEPSPAAASDTLVLRNVMLINQRASRDQVLVNVLVRNGQLELITEDEVSPVDEMPVFDAQNGALLGDLALGEHASFLILDGDPRDDFDLLLETGRHTQFAIRQGEVVTNHLARVEQAPQGSVTDGWLVYAPVPVALAISYADAEAWNTWNNETWTGALGGVIVLDGTSVLTQNSANEQLFGDLDEFDGSELRAFEIVAAGTINIFEEPWFYNFAAADNTFDAGYDSDEDDTFSVRDLRLDIPLSDQLTFSLGKTKEPISLERLTSLARLPYQERSTVSDALLPSRNVGALLSGYGFHDRATFSLGVFNDWLDQNGSFDRNASQAIGRATFLPVVSGDKTNILHLGLGARFSNGREEFGLYH